MSSRKVKVRCGSNCRFVVVDFGSYATTSEAIRRKWSITGDFVLQARNSEKEEYMDIVDDEDLAEFNEVNELLVRPLDSDYPRGDAGFHSVLPEQATGIVQGTPPPSYGGAQVQVETRRCIVTFGEVKKLLAVDRNSLENMKRMFKQRFEIKGNFQILAKPPGADDFFNVDNDEDLVDYNDADAYLIKQASSLSPVQMSPAAHPLEFQENIRHAVQRVTITNDPNTGTMQSAVTSQVSTQSREGRVVTACYKERRRSIAIDFSSVQKTRDTIRRRFKLNADFNLKAKVGDEYFEIEDDGDGDDLNRAESLIIEDLPEAPTTRETASQALALLSVETAEKRDVMLTIQGGQYVAYEVPSAKSGLVLRELNNIKQNFSIQSMVIKVDIVADCLRLARYGAAGDADLEMKVVGMQGRVAKIVQETNETVIRVRMKAGEILDDLKCGFGYLQDGIKETALQCFSDIGERSMEMKSKTVALSDKLDHEMESINEILNGILLQNKDRQSNIAKQRKEGDGSMKFQFLQDKVQQAKADKEDSEAKVKTVEKEIQENKGRVKTAMDKHTGCGHGCGWGICCHGTCHCSGSECCYRCCGGGFVCSLFHTRRRFYWYWSHLHRDNSRVNEEKDLLKKAEEEKRKEIQERKGMREAEDKAHEDVIAYLNEIDKRETELSEKASSALNGAESALKTLQMSVTTMVDFWSRLHAQLGIISTTGDKKVLALLAKNQTDEERNRIWSSQPFAIQAITFYAKWVALQSLCDDYTRRMQGVEMSIKYRLAEVPNAKEAAKKVTEIKESLVEKCKIAIDESRKMSEEDERALQAIG